MPEDCGKTVIEVQRLGSAVGAVSVKYATGDDTALSGTDYAAASGTLRWGDGDKSVRTISIPIVNRPDALDDYDRGFHVVLSEPSGGAVLGPAHTTIVGILGRTVWKP